MPGEDSPDTPKPLSRKRARRQKKLTPFRFPGFRKRRVNFISVISFFLSKSSPLRWALIWWRCGKCGERDPQRRSFVAGKARIVARFSRVAMLLRMTGSGVADGPKQREAPIRSLSEKHKSRGSESDLALFCIFDSPVIYGVRVETSNPYYLLISNAMEL